MSDTTNIIIVNISLFLLNVYEGFFFSFCFLPAYTCVLGVHRGYKWTLDTLELELHVTVPDSHVGAGAGNVTLVL